jgi:hypothetical protein
LGPYAEAALLRKQPFSSKLQNLKIRRFRHKINNIMAD